MIKVETSVVVQRPVEAVFEFMANPENDMMWQSDVVASKKTTDGPMDVGTTEESESMVFGQKVKTTYVVTAYEPNGRIEYTSTSGPFNIRAEYVYEAVGETDTKVSIIGEADVGGFFKLGEPILARMLNRQWETNIANLKDILEAQT